MSDMGMTGPYRVQTPEDYAEWVRKYETKESFYIPSPLFNIQRRIANHLATSRPDWEIHSEWDKSGNYLHVTDRATTAHVIWSQGVEWDDATHGFWTATFYRSEEALQDGEWPLLTHSTGIKEDVPVEFIAPIILALTDYMFQHTPTPAAPLAPQAAQRVTCG